MTEPLVSVNMITYNHAQHIAKAVEGILQQKTDFPFELVIGEDCSTDGTREVVFEYQERRPDVIQVITSEKNEGAKENSYRTMKACRGKYVAFCEGDDYWHNPYKLQKQVDYMQNHPECGLVHSDYDRYYPKTGKITSNFNRVMDNVPPDNLDMSSILRGGRYLYILTCTVLVRGEMLSAIVDSDPFLYRSGNFLIGDTPRWAEIAWRSKTHYIDESLATYTVMEESASKSADRSKTMRFGMSISELFLYLSQKYNLPESEYKYHTEKWCEYALTLAFVQNDKDLAREVKKKKTAFSAQQHLLYYGAMNARVKGVLQAVLSIKHKMFSTNSISA